MSRKFGGGALGLGTTIPAPRDTFFFNAPTQPGRYNLAVHYSGDSNFKSADANAVLVVN